MKHHYLLSLVVLLLAACSPIAAAWSQVSCRGDGSYAANSTYEANLRHLAAVLPAETTASRGGYVDRAIGYWPNRLQATSRCRSRDSDCTVCIADAFRSMERECPYHKAAVFFSGNCSLVITEFSVSVEISRDYAFGRNILLEVMNSGLIFQVIGLAFLCFLFLQTWRDNKKGTVTRHSPLLSGDQ